MHRNGDTFLPSLALIRAVAALMVVYDHLVGMWLEVHGVQWRPAQIVERWIFDPLQLMMHGGGIAVAMFFLVSGFVIVLVAERETLGQFAIRRAMRIFPPLWASIALLLIVGALLLAFDIKPKATLNPLAVLLESAHPWIHFIAASTLMNYIFSTPPINGVAWTLIIEAVFYVAVALLMPLLRTRPRVALSLAFVVLATLQVLARANAVLFMLTVNTVYVAFLFLGSVIYFRWRSRIGNVFFCVASTLFWLLFLHGMKSIALVHPFKLSDYGVSYATAWLIFVCLLLINNRLQLGSVTMFFSRISYSLYLNHGGIGLIVLTLLFPYFGYPVSLCIAFVLVVGISALSFRWIEAPSQRLAKAMFRGDPSGS